MSNADTEEEVGQEVEEETLTTEIDVNTLDAVTRQILQATIRTFLSAAHMSIAVNKNLLQQKAWGDHSFARVKINTILEMADSILRETRGLKIQSLPPKESTITRGKTKEPSQQQQQWILVSTLNEPEMDFHLEAKWRISAEHLFRSELDEERHDYRNNRAQMPVLKSDSELMLAGITLIVITTIIVNSNRMSETELLDVLQNDFGMSRHEHLNVLNQTTPEILKTLDKMGYVDRVVVATENTEQIVEYTIGRRTRLEFTKADFIEFLRVLYDINDSDGEDQILDFVTRMNQALEPVYGN